MMQQILKMLRPPLPPETEDKEEQRKYKRAVNNYHFNVSIIVAGLALIVAWGVSPYGFAYAADIQAKIDESVKPIKDEQAELKKTVDEIKKEQTKFSTRLYESLANTVASEIRFVYAKRCKETNFNEREALWKEIERKQEEYIELKGSKYNFNCAEL